MNRMKRLIPAVMLGAALVVAGCGQSSEQESVAKKETAAPSPHTGKGVGPIDHVDVASLDSSHAAEGAKVFEAKCTACHKLDERYIGPALSGVTERRKPEWIMNMILNPDVMVKEDDTAKALLAEYIAPMTNQNLTQEEAKLVLAYLLHNDGSKAAE